MDMIPLRIDCRTQNVAYVENRVPASGSNVSIARSRPRFPSATRSSSGSPRPANWRAMLTTNRRLARTRWSRASGSPAATRPASARS